MKTRTAILSNPVVPIPTTHAVEPSPTAPEPIPAPLEDRRGKLLADARRACWTDNDDLLAHPFETLAPEALKVIAKDASPELLEVFRGVITSDNRELSELIRDRAALYNGIDPERLSRATRILERREVASRQLHELAALMNVEASPPSARPELRLIPYWTQSDADCRPEIAERIVAAKADLADGERAIERCQVSAKTLDFVREPGPEMKASAFVCLVAESFVRRAYHASSAVQERAAVAALMGTFSGHNAPPMVQKSPWLNFAARLSGSIAWRNVAAARLERLEADLRLATNLVGSAVAKAIGDRDDFTKAVSALICKNMGADVIELEKAVLTMDDELRDRKDNWCQEGTPGFAKLLDRREEAHTRWTQARTAVATSSDERAAQLVSSALAGEEQARGELERLTGTDELLTTINEGLARSRLDRLTFN